MFLFHWKSWWLVSPSSSNLVQGNLCLAICLFLAATPSLSAWFLRHRPSSISQMG
uniref:Cysteine protease n=1 Tax=Rhizophora mucronata TaxID=61149 RepID=A0A2P2MZ70_RHIMU